MSIITPSRADLLPVHDPLFGPLQPSAMPPPPSVSPHVSTTGPFPLAPALERSRLEQYINGGTDKPVDVTTWRKGIDTGVTNSPRVALARVNTNTTAPQAQSRVDGDAANASASASASASVSTSIPIPRAGTSKPAGRVTSNSIPRPVAVPDVFADDKASFLPSNAQATSARPGLLTATAGKRARDSTHTGAGATSASTANASSKRARVEEDAWKTKWLKSFPNLVFHFEIGTEGNGKVLENRVKAMGARVDQFFSTRVTHLIAKPSTSPKKAMPPPRRPVKESPKNPFSDGTGVTDLVQKAEALNIKVWTVDKLVQMLTRLAPVAAPKDSLHTLLEDERIHGTRERDLNAPRPDYYYFKPGSKYLLIEDASNKHRTIMVKEYNFAPKDGAEWPILYEKFLRPSAANQSTIDPAKIRDRAWALYVEGVPFEGERPPRTELKRSTSLRALPTTPKLPEAMPYQNASGNSVVLTSNIASTSTAGNSPVMFGQNAMGMFKDRALSQMNKRVQVLKGNARLAAAKRSSTTEASIAELCSRRTTTANANSSTTATAGETSTSSKSTTSSAPSIPAKTFLSFTQLVGMLEQARLPVTDAGITAEMRIKNREKVENGLKGREQETAAGYCENCRVRYSDLSVHIESKRHRKFASNDANFASLDKLLSMLGRPVNPKISNPEFPPCEAEHTMDADCELCNYCPSEATHTSEDMTEFVSSQGTDQLDEDEEGEEEGEAEDDE